MSTQSDIHNRLAGQIVAAIVKPPIEAGGDYPDVLVLFESVAVGVMLVVAKLGGDEIVLDTVITNVKRRLAELRLGTIKTEGQG